ncbi:interferon beta-like [Latimeria chalumnae]|uniref:interferon beta-like n=1 Tax=Latimeria chalumnae TaxID=7897 RepID=UPI00313AFDCE
MALKTFVALCLLLFVPIGIFCQECEELNSQQRLRIRESLQELEGVGGKFPSQCLEGNAQFNLHKKVYQLLKHSKGERRITLVYEILQQINRIYRKNPSATWDQNKLERFQNVLHSQTEELWKCLEKKMSQSTNMNSQWINNAMKLSVRVKKNFKEMEKFLKHQVIFPEALTAAV